MPGAVQPHGVLFALDPTDLTIRCVSDNSERILGYAPGDLLGRGVAAFLLGEGAELAELLRRENLEERNPIPLRLSSGARFSAVAHRHDGRLILECEPEAPDADALRFYAYNRVRSSLVRLRSSRTLEELCEQTAGEVRLLTGFDRVLIYAFQPDWSGEVVAEACADGAQRYLGQRFPASDIPSQARALYTACRLRMIPRAAYTPAALVGSLDGRPLDLTHATLRSVSPVHREYMKNMGVTGSMGTSLMHDDRLWGLITCNHESGERFIPYETRTACALIGEVASVLIAQRAGAGVAAERAAFLDIQAKLIQLVVHDRDVVRGLTQHGPFLLDLTDATGAALVYEKEVYTVGKTPSREAIASLVSWIGRQGRSSLALDSLPAQFAPAHGWKDVGCGLLAAAITVEGSSSVDRSSWLLWFRPEVLQTIKWGADPNKPPMASSTGELHPRTSFERWREEVSLRCVPWSDADRAAAQSLAVALVDVVLEIESSRLFKENALVLAASNRNLLHQIEANLRVEQVLAARTEQLFQRETSLRVVLAAIEDGLVAVGLDGRLRGECSPAVEAWFGKLSGKTFLWELLFASDPAAGREFEVLFRQLASGSAPFDVAARPLCRELLRGERRLALGFKPVRQGRSLVDILVTIKDVTARSQALRAAREAEEAQAVFALLRRDARGVARTLRGLDVLSEVLLRAPSWVEGRRALRALEAEATALGLITLPERCRAAAEALAPLEGSARVLPEDALWISDELARVRARVEALGGGAPLDGIEVPSSELTEAAQRLEPIPEAAEVLTWLRRVAAEPAAHPMQKLASLARILARESGKSVEVRVDDQGVRVDPEIFEPIWTGLTDAVAGAVDHGVEPEVERRARGAAAVARLTLAAEDRRDGWVSVAVVDDGPGSDAARQSARDLGLRELREACGRVGAMVEIETEPGSGTTVRVRVPVSRR